MVAGAIPAGSARAALQVQWIAAVTACPDLASWRADKWKSLLAVAKVLAEWMDWETSTSRPTWKEVARRAGVSRSTVDRRLRDLQAVGFIGVVATGRSAGTDPNDPEAGNAAAVYVLTIPLHLQLLPETTHPLPAAPPADPPTPAPTHPGVEAPSKFDNRLDSLDPEMAQAKETGQAVPRIRAGQRPVDKSDTPTLTPRSECVSNPSAREKNATDPGDRALGARRPVWNAGVVPDNKDERLLAAAEARRRDPILRRASTVSVRAMFREWHLAGWPLIDILAALNRRPDGTPWPHQFTAPGADVRHVPGWVRHRMRAWRIDPSDPSSPPALSPTQLSLAAAARSTHSTAVRRAETTTARATAVHPDHVSTWTSARQVITANAAAARNARRAGRLEPRKHIQDIDRPHPAQIPPTGQTPARTETASDLRIAALRAAVHRG